MDWEMRKTETKAEGRTKGRKETKPLAKGIPVTISQTDTGMPIYLPTIVSFHIHHAAWKNWQSSLSFDPRRYDARIQDREEAVVIASRSTLSVFVLLYHVPINMIVPRTYRMGDENQERRCEELKVGVIERHERAIDARNGARRVWNGYGKDMLTISLPRAMYGQSGMKCYRKKEIPNSQLVYK
jgi:hypothetical protein